MKTIFGVIERERKPNKKYMFVKVLAEYKDLQLIEVKNPRLDYPSEGEAIWSPAPYDANVGKLGFFTVLERNEEDYLGGTIYSKYMVYRELGDLKYYEVFKMPFSLAQNKEIIYLIQNGIDTPQRFSSEILLLTKDDYLIGPYRIKQSKDGKWVIDSSDDKWLEIRKKSINLVEYYDKNIGGMRYFTSTMLIDHVEDYLDCATNERIMRYALKTLKEYQQIQEISRKVISQLSDLVGELPSQVHYERIMAAIELLTEYEVTEEDIIRFEGELLQYPAIQKKLETLLEEKFNAEKRRIEEEHRKTLNETAQLRKEKEHLLLEMEKLIQQIKISEEKLKKADEALNEKIRGMKENIFRTLADLAPLASLGLTVSQHQVTNYRIESPWTVKDNEETTVYDNIYDLMEHAVKNLSMLGIEDNKALLMTKTVIGAMLFRTPIVVKGGSSFELAQVIGWTIAGNEHLTIFPDMKNFNNQTLVESFSNYVRSDCVKSVHLCQIENSPAELYLPSFLDYWRVSIEESLPELILISIKEDSDLTNSFVQKLPFVPIINADEIVTDANIRSLRKAHSLVFGSIASRLLIEDDILRRKSSEFSNFLEIVKEVMPFTKQKESFKKWFRLLEDDLLDEEIVSLWITKVLLQPYIDKEKATKILDEFDHESITV
ncbi:hypothetical protein [Anoxybacillus sp. TBDG-1]